MADTIKCPNCGGNLAFNPASQKLECPYCGGAFLPSEIKSEADELAGSTTVAAAESSIPAEDVVNDVSEAISDEAAKGDSMEFICNACGAKVVTDVNTAATFCAFCGSPALVGQRLTEDFKPKYLIPFKTTKDDAKNAFLKWCKGGRWTPMNFVSEENINKITGLYVPFWLFDFDCMADLSGEAEESSQVGNTITTKYYSFARRGRIKWEKIPFDGETRIDDDLMESIEPFQFEEMVDYDYKYLPGFFADRYDLDPTQLMDRAVTRADGFLNKWVADSLGAYDKFKITVNNSKYRRIGADYALLPVWFMSYKYLGKNYYFAMNGQTGKVAGILPISTVKRIVAFFVGLAILAVVTRIIMGFIIGGFAG